MGLFAFTDQFLTTTALHRLEGLRDMTEKRRPRRFLDDLLRMGLDTVSGGHNVIVPWNGGEHSTTTQLSNGYEPLDMTVTTLGTPGVDDWFYAQRPILISGRDETINRSKAQIISILDSRVKDTEMGIKRQFEVAALRGTEVDMSDLNTIDGQGTATGFLERAAVGTQNNVVHGVAKNIGGGIHPYFQNQTIDFANSFSTTGLTGLYDADTRVEALYEDGEAEQIYYGGIAFMNNLKRAVGSQEMYIGEDLDPGKRVAMFGGKKIRVTTRLPDGTLDVGFPWSMILIDWNNLRFIGQEGKVFSLSPFQTISGHDVRAAFYNIFGQLACPAFGSHALGVRGETW